MLSVLNANPRIHITGERPGSEGPPGGLRASSRKTLTTNLRQASTFHFANPGNEVRKTSLRLNSFRFAWPEGS